MSWEEAEKLALRAEAGSSRYVKLQNDGDKFVGVFLGDPLPREVVWTGQGYVDASTPEGRAILTDEGRRPSVKFAMNVYVPEDETMKIWEMNNQAFKNLLKLKEKYGLKDRTFEVIRHGEKGSPKTTYSILPEEKLNADEVASLADMELHDLELEFSTSKSDTPF